MLVSRWGNSLAIRLPAAVVEALSLREGDEIEVNILGARRFAIERDQSRDAALDSLRKLRRALPAGCKFDREEANER